MRKLHVVILLCLVSVITVAQPGAGKVLLGGDFQFSTGFNGGDYPVFSIRPSAAYFTGERNALGLSVGFSRSYGSTFLGETFKLNAWSLSVFDRKYFQIGGEEKVFFFLNSRFDYTIVSSPDDNIATGGDGYTIGISPGLSYFPTPSVGIDLSVPGLSYSNSNQYLVFDTRLSNVSLGVSILLNRKRKD
jgi:hypothetical protein